MNRRIKQIGLVFALGVQALMYQNCSDARFTNDGTSFNESVGTVDPSGNPQCRTDLIDSTRTVKLMLVVDVSGSNVDSRSATDAQKKWRLAAINSLVNKYGAKSNIHFSLATFSHHGTQVLIKDSAGNPAFSNLQSEIQAGVEAFKNSVDDGGTPYKKALGIAQEMVQKDLQTNTDKNSVYSVILISDGMPDDVKTVTEIIPPTASITELAEGRVNVNSVFYYSTNYQRDNIDKSYLKKIAEVGHGKFAIANSNESINLNDTIKVPQEVCN